jgi:coproporphyrinogen III oxidase-like Fe-S oxidoreductase
MSANNLDNFEIYNPTRFYPEQSEQVSAVDVKQMMRDYLKRHNGFDFNLNIVFPFCSKRCYFCFCNTKKLGNELNERYLKFLANNLEFFAPAFEKYRFNDLLIGSGSCNLLTEAQLDKLLNKIFLNFNFKTRNKTIEIFPDNDFTDEKISILLKYGINKISIGVETFNKKVIESANRNYSSPQQIQGIIKRLNDNKIININLDFILGLKGQTLSDLMEDLIVATRLQPAQIALYTLQPTSTYIKLFFKNKDEFYEHIEKYTKQLDKIDKLMQRLGYDNYCSNEHINIYYNQKYKTDLEPRYFDYPFFGQYKENESDFSIGQYSPTYLTGKAFITNSYNKTSFLFDEDEKSFELIDFSDEDYILDFVLAYWGRGLALPLKDFEDKFNFSLTEKYPRINKLMETKVLNLDNDKLVFNSVITIKERMLYLLEIFPKIKELAK